MTSMFRIRVYIFLCLLAIAGSLLQSWKVDAATYIFAGESRPESVTHPLGYLGTSGNITITVGIDPTSTNASDMVIPTQNVLRTLNALVATIGTLDTSAPDMPSGGVDYESVLLHEMGHSMGLAHVNFATESGEIGNNQNYTKSTDGPNDILDFTSGTDTIIGSSDDSRGDDVNLYWYRKDSNDPLATVPTTVDSTTYVQSGNLPVGHTFAANSDRLVSADLGYANTEGIMQQGTFSNEAQRDLTSEGVAGFRLAQAGSDRSQSGTSDNYTWTLTYAGLTTIADIVIDFDNSETGFAVSSSFGSFLGPSFVDAVITFNDIYFNTGYNWYFNQVSNEDVGNPDNLYVDFSAGSNGSGTEISPFDNLADAISALNVGGTINLEPATTSTETFKGASVISKQLNFATTGTVSIGIAP
jgi:hypothetical protein